MIISVDQYTKTTAIVSYVWVSVRFTVDPRRKTARNYKLTAMTLTKVVFPEYCSPTSVSSISSFQNKLLNQSRMRFIRASMVAASVCRLLRWINDVQFDFSFIYNTPVVVSNSDRRSPIIRGLTVR